MPSPLEVAVAAAAHDVAASLVRGGLDAADRETVGVAVVESGGIKVVVSVTRHLGECHFHPAPGFDTNGHRIEPEKTPKEKPIGADGEQGSPVACCIMEAAPLPHEPPVTLRKLSRLAGYSYTRWFREAVDELVVAGKLVRSSRGVKRST